MATIPQRNFFAVGAVPVGQYAIRNDPRRYRRLMSRLLAFVRHSRERYPRASAPDLGVYRRDVRVLRRHLPARRLARLKGAK